MSALPFRRRHAPTRHEARLDAIEREVCAIVMAGTRSALRARLLPLLREPAAAADDQREVNAGKPPEVDV